MRFLLISFVLISNCLVPVVAQSISEIKVVSFNLWRRNGSWPERLQNAIELIEGQKADIVGLQEGDENTQYDVEGGLANYELETGPWNEQASSILFNTNTITILESGTFGYSSQPDNPNIRDWGDGAIHGWLRTCLWVLAEHKPSGQKFYMYNTHLDANGFSSNPGYWRALETQLLSQRVAARSHPEYPYIVVGDLNGVENEEAITYLKSAANNNPAVMVDTYREILPNGPGDSFGSVKYDYIMVAAENGQYVVDANIIYQSQYGFTSDHNQVYALIDFQNVVIVEPQDSLWLLTDYDNINLNFDGFGGSSFSEVSNPTSSVRNPSQFVGTTTQGSETWAGIYSSVLSRTIDFEISPMFDIKVLAETSGDLLVKFESSANSEIFYERTVSVQGSTDWQELEIDFSDAPSNLYDRVVLFFDFGVGAPDTYYFDDLMLVHPHKRIDCNGDQGGAAHIDKCNVCSGGNTGVVVDNCIITSNKSDIATIEFAVYPNPTQGVVHLNRKSQYILYDLLGTMVFEGSGTELDLSNLAIGIYKLWTPEGVSKIKKD